MLWSVHALFRSVGVAENDRKEKMYSEMRRLIPRMMAFVVVAYLLLYMLSGDKAHLASLLFLLFLPVHVCLQRSCCATCPWGRHWPKA